jgi:5-methylthioribose kinase
MERIDPRMLNWKSELLSGRVDLVTASRVGELLGWLHSRSATQSKFAVEFAERRFFEQLRIEPFFTRIAQRNPDLAADVSLAIAALRAPGEALVHGDYSPKNLLVDGADVVILDFEVAHWGNPRFDIAFCMAHLLLKGLRHGAERKPFANAAHTFASAYRAHGFNHVLDAMLVRITGCLLVARFEGDSPVDYREQLDATYIKQAASKMIVQPTGDIDRAVERYFEKT